MLKDALEKALSKFFINHTRRIIYAFLILIFAEILYVLGYQENAINVIMLIIGAFIPDVRKSNDAPSEKEDK